MGNDSKHWALSALYVVAFYGAIYALDAFFPGKAYLQYTFVIVWLTVTLLIYGPKLRQEACRVSVKETLRGLFSKEHQDKSKRLHQAVAWAVLLLVIMPQLIWIWVRS